VLTFIRGPRISRDSLLAKLAASARLSQKRLRLLDVQSLEIERLTTINALLAARLITLGQRPESVAELLLRPIDGTVSTADRPHA
jgi:hypothetical protein